MIDQLNAKTLDKNKCRNVAYANVVSFFDSTSYHYLDIVSSEDVFRPRTSFQNISRNESNQDHDGISNILHQSLSHSNIE